MFSVPRGLVPFLFFPIALFAQEEPTTIDDPNPCRFEDQIAAFNEAFHEGGVPTDAIVAVGSSSMRMWHPRIAEDLSPLTIVPRGFGGSHYSDLNFFFHELVAVYKPRAILVYEGDNDVNAGKPPEQVLEDFMEFRAKVNRLDPEIRIYVIGVKPSTTRWHWKNEINETNRLIAEECSRDERMTYIDVAEYLLGDDGNPLPSIFIGDGVHLNRLGYNLWAAAVGLVLIPAEEGYEAFESESGESEDALATEDLPSEPSVDAAR